MKRVIETVTLNKLVREVIEPTNQQQTIHQFDTEPLKYSIRNNQITCNVCDKEFSTKSSLTRHMRTHSKGVKKFLCPVCQFPCGNKSNLMTHHRRKHKGQTIQPSDIIEVVMYETEHGALSEE